MSEFNSKTPDTAAASDAWAHAAIIVEMDGGDGDASKQINKDTHDVSGKGPHSHHS